LRVAEHGISSVPASPIGGMRQHEGDERGRRGLLALGVVLLAKPKRCSPRVDVAVPEVERALAAGAGLEVEPDQEKVPVGVGAGGSDCVGELGELPVVERNGVSRHRSGGRGGV